MTSQTQDLWIWLWISVIKKDEIFVIQKMVNFVSQSIFSIAQRHSKFPSLFQLLNVDFKFEWSHYHVPYVSNLLSNIFHIKWTLYHLKCYNHYWEPRQNQQLVFDIKEIHYFYIEVICDKQSLAYEFDLNQTLKIILYQGRLQSLNE